MPAARGSTHPLNDGRIRYALACRTVITVSPQACPVSAGDLLKCMLAAVRTVAFCVVGGCSVAECWAGPGWAGFSHAWAQGL